MRNWIAEGLYHTILGWRYLRFPSVFLCVADRASQYNLSN